MCFLKDKQFTATISWPSNREVATESSLFTSPARDLQTREIFSEFLSKVLLGLFITIQRRKKSVSIFYKKATWCQVIFDSDLENSHMLPVHGLIVGTDTLLSMLPCNFCEDSLGGENY